MATAASDRPSVPVAETSFLPAAHVETSGTSARPPASARRCNNTCGGKSSTRDANVGTTTTLKRRFRRAAAGHVPRRIAEKEREKLGKGQDPLRGKVESARSVRTMSEEETSPEVSDVLCGECTSSFDVEEASAPRPSPDRIDIIRLPFLPRPDEDRPDTPGRILCVHGGGVLPSQARRSSSAHVVFSRDCRRARRVAMATRRTMSDVHGDAQDGRVRGRGLRKYQSRSRSRSRCVDACLFAHWLVHPTTNGGG